jgi:hypothetical protein
VRNVRAADGRLATIVGRRREEWVGRELSGADKVPVLRAYLRRWKAEVGVFFEGASADSSDDELAAIAPRHPVFVLEPAAAAPPATSTGATDTGPGAADTDTGPAGTDEAEPGA